MLVSLKWLRCYVDCEAPAEEIAERLTMAGLEVEGLSYRGQGLARVVVGRIAAIHPHPNADRLRVCTVEDGRSSLQVVCGAPNLEVGQLVPLALEGARLANGTEVRRGDIRGVVSEAMLCSEHELGLGEDTSGVMVLPADLQAGIPLAAALEADDVILEIGITPNRGDCLSILGVAREVAALFKLPLIPPAIAVAEAQPEVTSLAAVRIDAPDLCPRYAARVIRNLRVGPSPWWLRQRLASANIRSINNIVDVTNFVMLELGQPLHAFDYNLLHGRQIIVRRARPGETFVTLDEASHQLREDMLLICDADRGVALAGIMGGLNSEISPDTTDVLLESAYFDPTGIRRTAKRLGMSTESSYRFERGVDPEGVIRALDRAAQLIAELGGGQVARGRLDAYPRPIEPKAVRLRLSRTRRFLGLDLPAAEIKSHLQSIQLQVEKVDQDVLQVRVPTFRPDLEREVDLIEEVARLAGYDRIPITLPRAQVNAAPPAPEQTLRHRAKEAMVALGFAEVISYAFANPRNTDKLMLKPNDRRRHHLHLLNPLSEDQAAMRTSLIPGLLEIAARNQHHNNFDLRLFELSSVFYPRPQEELPEEHLFLAGLLAGRRAPLAWCHPEDQVDFYDAKGAVEALLEVFGLQAARWSPGDPAPYLEAGAAARIFVGENCLGDVGALRSEVLKSFRLRGPIYLFDLDFELLAELATTRKTFVPLPKFPAVNRDMAMVLPESIPAQDVMDFLLKHLPEQAEAVRLFDHYRGDQVGPGKKSLAFRITYRARDRSLTDTEVNAIHSKLSKQVLERFGATLRT